MRLLYNIFINIFVMLFFSSMTCSSGIQYKDVELINNSNDTIYEAYYFTEDGSRLDYFTIDYIFNNKKINNIIDTIIPTSSALLYIPEWDYDGSDKYNLDIQNRIRLYILILKKSTLENYSIDSIVSNNIIDKEYIFSYHELKNMNFKIIYNGD